MWGKNLKQFKIDSNYFCSIMSLRDEALEKIGDGEDKHLKITTLGSKHLKRRWEANTLREKIISTPNKKNGLLLFSTI